MTKIIIVEGPDNIGKDTLINKLKCSFKTPIVFHAGVPDENFSLFDFYYNGLIHNTLDTYYKRRNDIIIHNRSIYGEFVYGPKYRSMSRGAAAELVYKLESGQLRTFIPEDDLFLIVLTSTDIDLLANNDDGKSLSLANKDNIKYEVDAFDTIFKLSEIKNKKRTIVNNGSLFRDSNDIYKEIYNFITK